MKFRAQYVTEQNLVFGGLREEKDPRLGLKYYGPFKYEEEQNTSDTIKLGLVGDKNTLELAKRIIGLISNPIPSLESNNWLYPDFPGISPSTNFKCSIITNKTWQQTILQEEIDRILQIPDANERIGAAVDLYLSKINSILAEDNPSDVILCCLPKAIEDYCGISPFTRCAKNPKLTELDIQLNEFKKANQQFLSSWGVVPTIKQKKSKGYDLRNALKGRVMGFDHAQPIQILRESTMKAILEYDPYGKKIRQEPASFAWNLSTALFYKANGKPWRLAKLQQDSCYVGISFYKDKLSGNKNIETSMAQIFTHDGQGLVLKGTEVYIDEKTKEPHLSEKQAEDLLKKALAEYTAKAKRPPVRIVIHKSTLFTDAEKTGFGKASQGLKKDFVTISQTKGIKFMRNGKYPVLRGTLITLTESQHILFSSGYTPRIRTYPGHSIPHPLFITHMGDSEISEICEEILGLTKLNWNTTAFSTFLPITLEFSSRVGDILSEIDPNARLQHHYKFYM